MSLWGNNDKANSKPIFPILREVSTVTTLITANTVANTIWFTTSIPSSVANGQYVYSLDANNSVSRFFDGSIVEQNDVSFYKANNTIRSINNTNNTITLAATTLSGVLANGSTIWIANNIPYTVSRPQANTVSDTILVTASRLANGNTLIAGANSSVHPGWVKYTRKINSDGTIRFLKEVLVCLANATASNVSSGNTASNSIFRGL